MNTNIPYKALVADKQKNGEMKLSVRTVNTRDLPDHDVLIRVHYSSLNYKDALSASGNPGVTKSYPHTPGIDAAGVIEQSSDPRFSVGDEVIVTSYDLGQNTPGGFGEYICVPGDWVVNLPEGLSLEESMILGTAGFTAGYGVKKIISQNIGKEDGDILVTGSTGGVGSMAVAILAQLGFSVTAVTGKQAKHSYLESLGADTILGRDVILDVTDAPMLSSRWIGAIETVGGEILDSVLRQISHNGVVACCGNVRGGEIHTSIYPFILRGVSLMGIDSGMCLMKDRKEIWTLLSGDWKPAEDILSKIYRKCQIQDLPWEMEKILKGEQTGRLVVTLRD